MKQIPLTQGKVALVDDEDFEWLSQWKWYASITPQTCYAIRSARVNKRNLTIRMHRQILGLVDSGDFCDHISGNGLDNRRANLRICSAAENSLNCRPRKGGTSRFKGVHFLSSKKRWASEICIDGKQIHLGFFNSEKEAAQAYNFHARHLHGDFAKLNMVEPMFPIEAKSLVLRSSNTSGFRGVSFDKKGGKWCAIVGHERKLIRLGKFDNPEDAARAYDTKAREIYGERAKLNFPNE